MCCVLQSAIVPAPGDFLILRNCSVFRGEDSRGVSRVAYWKKENSQVNHSSSRKLMKMASFFAFLTPPLLCFCPSSSCLSPQCRRKRKYVTLMDSNFDNAYPEDVLFGYISSRDFSSIRSDSINHSGHTDMFLDNWFLYDVVSVTRGLVLFN